MHPLCLQLAYLVLLLIDNTIQSCINSSTYDVVIGDMNPLGVRFDSDFRILQFVPDSDGRPRTVEATRIASIGDHLISVQGKILKEFSFRESLDLLRSNTVPKTLRFEASQAQCHVDQADSEAGKIDYLETSSKDTSKSILTKYVAVLSKDSGPPACDAAEVAIAEPQHSCSTLRGDLTGKHILIPVPRCIPYQKALFAQNAGAKSVIFVQHHGLKPVQVVVPSYSKQSPTTMAVVKIPLVMISAESGLEIITQLERLNPSTESLQLRLVLSSTCLAPKYSHSYVSEFTSRSFKEEARKALAGYITFHVGKTQRSFEFVRLGAEDKELSMLPFGTSAAYFASLQDQKEICKCALESSQYVSEFIRQRPYLRQHVIVIFPSQKACSTVDLLSLLSNFKVKGIVYGEDNNDLFDPAILHALWGQRGRTSEQYPTSHLELDSQPPVELSPLLLISGRSARTIRSMMENASSVDNIYLELYPENALHHQWNDLALLLNPANWPTCATMREKLLRRISKGYISLDGNEQQNEISPAHGNKERCEILVALYDKAASIDIEGDAITTD
uniref:Uncharacterized protein AlNc14C1G213 n=1 Tax=Albugo laibachii Nc14 TaxID=890382 RepID=F0VZ82_9STRA|nr:conserved hypothetical protein [Albugo laibachii Nc14]|eukprot:CCA14098.1 conserved hypothetical protein [Albugo laibachii Nc14]